MTAPRVGSVNESSVTATSPPSGPLTSSLPSQTSDINETTRAAHLEALKTAIPVAHVFDVDQRTGFMAPEPPLARLPDPWELWEQMLDEAVSSRLQLGDKLGLTPEEAETSRLWREKVAKMPVLGVSEFTGKPILLRRAHLVLTFILHFYVQSQSPPKSNTTSTSTPPSTSTGPDSDSESCIHIPKSISLPLLRVSKELDIPPLLTFSDTVLYNWTYNTPPTTPNPIPQPSTIRTQTMFTNTIDEEEFYLCSGRIELRGVEILEHMRMTMDEVFVGDDIAVRRITEYLRRVAGLIGELKALLMSVRERCDPEVYYNEVRPWFRGEDSVENKRKWVFDLGDEEREGEGGVKESQREMVHPTELSGPSAGQSSMVHVLDIFLGVDHRMTSPGQESFMSRMQKYMPRNHRLFLDHLKANPRPLRGFVEARGDAELVKAFDEAVGALKEFRDAHMIIATLYILGPARRAARRAAEAKKEKGAVQEKDKKVVVKGTGGSDLVTFLKETRERTKETMLGGQ
ncbi:hypothetical protein CVT24_001726 [Panaeolus cyanescens]|uniref:Indoleamine 2,3-dioxygenase n=1 Tax=Panaeolus cyanescens TaxID=181874 RepID=A0A409YFR7_9AGAR|nr:hypothetical protein CVT24_001726 [Panaeolus cyanescens]